MRAVKRIVRIVAFVACAMVFLGSLAGSVVQGVRLAIAAINLLWASDRGSALRDFGKGSLLLLLLLILLFGMTVLSCSWRGLVKEDPVEQ